MKRYASTPGKNRVHNDIELLKIPLNLALEVITVYVSQKEY